MAVRLGNIKGENIKRRDARVRLIVQFFLGLGGFPSCMKDNAYKAAASGAAGHGNSAAFSK